MSKRTTAVALALILLAGTLTFAQSPEDEAPTDASGPEESAAGEDDAADDDGLDPGALDLGTFEAEVDPGPADTIFTPSEEIKADTEISFPSDI